MIELTITGQEELNQRLQKVAEAEWFDAFLRDLAQETFNDVEQRVARHSKSGVLERSLGSGAIRESDRTFVVKSDGQIAPYNIFLHWGSRPHEIRPKDRKALRWVSGNKFVFAKFTKHPGYSGDPFMVNATQAVLSKFDSMVQRYLKDI